MAWTPDLTVVPGAWGGEMVAAGLRLGNRLQGYQSRLEGLGAEAALRPSRAARGARQGSSSYWFSTGSSNEGTVVGRAQTPCLGRPPEGRGWGGGFHAGPSAPAGL